jgi:hypothetical protein
VFIKLPAQIGETIVLQRFENNFGGVFCVQIRLPRLFQPRVRREES